MDANYELRRVLEIQINYMDGKQKYTNKLTSLESVRQQINQYKKHLSILTPVSILLGTLVCFAAVATIFGAVWIPWEKVGIVVVASFAVIIPTVRIHQNLELVKKRELFLIMLHKINEPSHN